MRIMANRNIKYISTVYSHKERGILSRILETGNFLSMITLMVPPMSAVMEPL